MSAPWDSPFADLLGDIKSWKRQAEEAVQQFQDNWGADVLLHVEAAIRSGEFDFEGGTPEEHEFLREVLREL